MATKRKLSLDDGERIIIFDAGGVIIKTTSTTIKGTILETLAASETCKKTSEGAIFLDYDGDVLRVILQKLRFGLNLYENPGLGYSRPEWGAYVRYILGPEPKPVVAPEPELKGANIIRETFATNFITELYHYMARSPEFKLLVTNKRYVELEWLDFQQLLLKDGAYVNIGAWLHTNLAYADMSKLFLKITGLRFMTQDKRGGYTARTNSIIGARAWPANLLSPEIDGNKNCLYAFRFAVDLE
jgi:hypothetical protein